MKQKEFKEKMPQVASMVDDLIELFGKEYVHDQIRAGLKGEPTFYAWEGEHVIGTPTSKGAKSVIAWDARDVSFSVPVEEGVSPWNEVKRITAIRDEQ